MSHIEAARDSNPENKSTQQHGRIADVNAEESHFSTVDMNHPTPRTDIKPHPLTPHSRVAYESLSMSDLTRLARAGDNIAFGQLTIRTKRQVLGTAFNITHHPEEARDVAQEAYLRAYRALPRFDGNAPFSTWMHTITANSARDHMKKLSKNTHNNLPEDSVLFDERAESSPEGMAEVSALREQLLLALEHLPESDQHIIDLGYFQELPLSEIAALLELSADAAKQRLHRARKKLKKKVLEMTNIENS